MLFQKNALRLIPAFCFFITLSMRPAAQPLDDITTRSIVAEKQVLAYDVPHERDVFWQKRIWRVLDVQEKMNLPFMYPDAPFFEILTKAAAAGELTLYSAEKDDFAQPLLPDDLNGILYRSDTVPIFDPVTYEETYKVVRTSVFFEDIKRFRIKEMWYFDANTSTMRTRILGIAPLKMLQTENGDYIGEAPMFWVHYPSARETLARHLVFNEGNEASRMTWEDLFEMRHFSSYIIKEGNVRNNRLQEIYSGVDLLLEADKIKQEIFDYEHDLWEY